MRRICADSRTKSIVASVRDLARDLFRRDAEAQGISLSEYGRRYGLDLEGTTARRATEAFEVAYLDSLEKRARVDPKSGLAVPVDPVPFGRKRGRPRKRTPSSKRSPISRASSARAAGTAPSTPTSASTSSILTT